jgi:putative membrane protein
VAQTTPWVADPAAAAAIPVNTRSASAAPLGAAPTAAPASAQAPPEPTTLRERAPLNDEQIVAVITAANGAELEQAKLAREKAKDAELRKLAAKVVSEHEQVGKAQKQLLDKLALKAAPSSVSDELDGDAASTLATLKKAKATDFDGVYLDAQLRSQQKLLELLDTELVPNAKSVDLRTFLQASQARAQARLDALKKLQATQTAKGAGGAPSK